MDERAVEEAEKGRESRTLENETYGDPLVFVIDFYVVSFPGDGGLRMTTWGNTLHYSWLSCCHNNIARGLPEIIPQNCTTERSTNTERVRGSSSSSTHGLLWRMFSKH